MYLDAALASADAHAYPIAFALLRCALELRCFDRLLFLGTVHAIVYEDITEEEWARWQEHPPGDLEHWERLDKDRVRVVLRGLHVVDEQQRVVHDLSIYYRWWKLYEPFAVPADDLDHIVSGHPSRRAEMAAHAKAQQNVWWGALRWKTLTANLLLNGLITERGRVQLDVHYRFLSVFVHPVSEDVTDAVYWQRIHGNWPTDEHFAEELALLYVCTFAIDELQDFERMAQRAPQVDLSAWDAVRTRLEVAEAEIAHFWAPGRRPYSYDRVHEAIQRVFEAYDAQHAAGVPLTVPPSMDPGTLADDDVRYYPDPLRRLIRLHAGLNEVMARQSWSSPWPRHDAQFRM